MRLIVLVTLAFLGGIWLGAAYLSGPRAAPGGREPVSESVAGQNPVNTDESGLKEIKFVCNDDKLRPFWFDLLKEKRLVSILFQSRLQPEYDCSRILRVSDVDLNGDGHPEQYVRFDTLSACSATANCPVAVYRIDEYERSQMRTSAGIMDFSLRRILFNIGALSIEFQDTTTNGFKDAVVRVNANPDGHYLERYKFDGDEYKRDTCFEDRGTGAVERTSCWDAEE